MKDKAAEDLAVATWEDLLACTLGISPQFGIASKKKHSLHGGFSLCRLGEKDAAQPPSRSLSLELMATLLREAPFVFLRVGQNGLVRPTIREWYSYQARYNCQYLQIEEIKPLLLLISTPATVQYSTDNR